MQIIFDRNTEEKKRLKLSDYLNQFSGITAILKALEDLASSCFTPWNPAAKAIHLHKMSGRFTPR